MTYLGDDRFYTELVRQTDRIAEVLHDADPQGRVPSCPEWTVLDLIEHVGLAPRGPALLVERRSDVLLPRSEIGDVEVPSDADGRSAWLHAGAERLVAAAREAGPDTPVWTWSADKTVRFWLRRITHDVLVHRIDAELTAGRPSPIEPDLAADNITDQFESFATISSHDADFDHPLRALRGTGQTLHLHATDDGLGEAGEWLCRREPGGLRWQHGHGKADTAVRGPVEQLLLLMHRRVELADARVEVFGDQAVLADWLENSRF